MTPAGMTCIRDALVAHYAELAQRGEIPCAQVPILADLDINQLKGMINMSNLESVVVALEACYEQMQQCEKMFRDDAEFVAALSGAEVALRVHGKL